VTPAEREAVGRLADALTSLDHVPTARAAVAEALSRLAGAEGGVLLLGRKFDRPAPGDVPDADFGPVRPKADRVLELLPAFGHKNPALPLIRHVSAPSFAVPELVGTAAWTESAYYREFLGGAMDTHAVLGVALRAPGGELVGGMWLGHPDRRRFPKSVRRTVDRVAGAAARALVNLARWESAFPPVSAGAAIDPAAARAAGLTARETELLELLADGLGHKQAAAALGVSYHTVTTHARNLFAKLRVTNRVDAINSVRRRT
jgi:DNA-binding CsgD family transcriptional regulator/GAF domain-containing protein